MASEETPFRNDSNWTFMYVVLSLIPVAFIAVAFYSTYRDKKTIAQKRDIEMATHAPTPQRPRFPWRELAAAPPRPGNSNPYKVQAASRPPVSPLTSRHGPSVSSKNKEADGTTRGKSKNPTEDVAMSSPTKPRGVNGEQKQPDFENVPL